MATAQAELFTHADNTDQENLKAAESSLLELADYAYAHTSLKPMSKALFFISRCLLVVRQKGSLTSPDALADAYQGICHALGAARPSDDYSFEETVHEVASHLPHLVGLLSKIHSLAGDGDTLGLAFDTLLRGKWETGEGLGTFLTPEEVVTPIVTMMLEASTDATKSSIAAGPGLFGDICGGTGRFVYHLSRALQQEGVPKKSIVGAARLFDQSRMAVDLARLNFAMDDMTPGFSAVADSLTDVNISALRGRFAFLATNPPFGAAKYKVGDAVKRTLPRDVLHVARLDTGGSSADPAFLFLFRNLELLADGGVLGIVLPDGLIQSTLFINALKAYEQERNTSIAILAVVSLPVAAFALGGTVAKTSFMILRRSSSQDRITPFFASAEHVGFLKRGNRRVPDPKGNNLVRIATQFRDHLADSAGPCWRELSRIVTPIGSAASARRKTTGRLGDVATFIRVSTAHRVKEGHYHISILDVDETGLIDVVAASRNAPITRCLAVKPNDILISCLNPKLWRVTVIPPGIGEWTCSAEFAVFRARRAEEAPKLFVILQHKSVRDQVAALAGGTSSSRQRVRKEQLLEIVLPEVVASGADVERFVQQRSALYRIRAEEVASLTALAKGESHFRSRRVST
jgi:type I restriction-modification system DNA methylase subunit